MNIRRRRVVGYGAGLAGSSFLLAGCGDPRLSEQDIAPTSGETFFKISLAQWSLHRALRKDLDNLEFAAKTRSFGLNAVEYVNQFFKDKAEDSAYLAQMRQRANDQGVSSVRIMIDGEGSLAHRDTAARKQAIENHYKWVRAAHALKCMDIRVNARGKGDPHEIAGYAAESLHTLASYAAQENIGIVVENHGGWSSDGQWLAGVMAEVNLPNCGTLPDFGNFRINLFPPRAYDRYQGTAELMPYAAGVSAKTYDFTAEGEETTIDYARMLNIVKSAGYRGYIGIEYEGNRLSEEAGIQATLNLLRRHGAVG